MQVIIHTGAHFTEADRLLKSLLRNTRQFHANGISVPGPGKYRVLLKETFAALRHAPPAEDAGEVLIDAILDDENANRVILSNPHFFGSARYSLIDGDFYPQAPERMKHLTRLFHDHDLEMFMSVRAPVTFLSTLVEPSPDTRLADVMGGVNPLEMRWSDMLGRVRDQLPDLPITVWCYEDAPLIWSRIIRALAGLPDNTQVRGPFDLLTNLISPEGMQEFLATLRASGGPADPAFITETILAHGLNEALEQELHLPGWSPELIEDMQWAYEEDLERISRIPNLRLIEP
ncbi:hypothetical protein [Pukyongiella litopenaei]|uniref:Uncharacterized protein n=1 Tax=Pukyongiella litopenaei TaxID=2605946 RepID=A0A2S0MK60_9RHOB|nr:hypothetical protein [Pukyongiella litopenaei]AVO36278.1 hypothetical protein C6Y53_00170 [Pukyongiella litopenaei]